MYAGNGREGFCIPGNAIIPKNADTHSDLPQTPFYGEASSQAKQRRLETLTGL